MDTDLVKLAQDGDKGAFTTLAAARADRFLAASHRILRDLTLAEDATQQALLSIWRDLPQLRDPARFDAWSYRLLVRACYAEGRRTRRWASNLRLLPADEPMLSRSRRASTSSSDRGRTWAATRVAAGALVTDRPTRCTSSTSAASASSSIPGTSQARRRQTSPSSKGSSPPSKLRCAAGRATPAD